MLTEQDGGELAVSGPHSVSADDVAASLEREQTIGREDVPADGPLAEDRHPPRAEDEALEATQAISSPAHDEAGEGARPGPLQPTPAPIANWQAALNSKGGFPADAQIAVSATHVIVTNRQRLRYYDKNGNALGSDMSSKAFFTAGINLTDAAGNPIDRFNDLRVIFDEYRKRFWVTACARFTGAANVPADERRTLIPIAVSKTQDPLDGWLFYWWDGAAQEGQPRS
jgi:hypothetical protein